MLLGTNQISQLELVIVFAATDAIIKFKYINQITSPIWLYVEYITMIKYVAAVANVSTKSTVS